jgi:hypothetical protein
MKVAEYGDHQWRISSSECDTFVTETIVNDAVVSLLDAEVDVAAHYLVSMPLAYGGLLALQHRDVREALKNNRVVCALDAGRIDMFDVSFARPDFSFYWRTAVRFDRNIDALTVNRISARW